MQLRRSPPRVALEVERMVGYVERCTGVLVACASREHKLLSQKRNDGEQIGRLCANLLQQSDTQMPI